MGALGVCCFLLLSHAIAVYMAPCAPHCNKKGSANYQKLVNDYMANRKTLIAKDASQGTGQSIILTNSEKKANDILMAWKRKELDAAFLTEDFIGMESFITARAKIEKSKVFQIIRKMPKGADLHLHDMSIASYNWLISNVTTMKICYMCYNTVTKTIEFKISVDTPKSTINCQWISTPTARLKSGNPKKFDAQLFQNLTMTEADPRTLYKNQNEVWKKFGGIFGILSGLLGFNDVFSGYYQRSLEELLEDNIQYAEIRALLFPLHDAKGNTFDDPEYALKIYKDVTEKFVAKNKDSFFGAKFIYIQTRKTSKDSIGKAVNKALNMTKKYPDLVSGFDLVGQEDAGYPLLYFLNELLIPKSLGANLPYYFHAGETNWEGQSVDYNIADALLLKTKRIGHGFALAKHKTFLEEAKSKGIAVEVCPISNQVLCLVSDLRNHPAASFLDQNVPMTVNSDDPPIWGATGLSHDFYLVFMAMTRYDSDIRVLKQLAMNSIKYSTLEASKKAKLQSLWQRKWDEFINTVIKEFTFPN